MTRPAKPAKEKQQRKTYHVYFSQVNQTRYTVKATSEESAIVQATLAWRRDYQWPSGVYVEVE